MVLFICALLIANFTFAFQSQDHLFNETGTAIHLHEFTHRVKAGDVVVVGELHGFHPHHQNQITIIRELQALGFNVAVGVEHLAYPQQNFLDQYTSGKIDEPTFMSEVGWRKSSYTNCFEYTEKNGFEDPFSALPFDCYREQLLLPGQRHSDSLALNLPRSITNKVFKGGLSALSPEDRALLPPYFHRGNDKYYQRFRENILGNGQHGPISEETIDNMFWAQSLWDETMAWTASQYMQRQPHAILVILVGDFHAQYGGGLPAQLKSRGTLRVHTVSQMAMAQASMDEMKEAAAPHLQYGERADLTIITNVQ